MDRMTEGGSPLDSKVQKLIILFVFDRMAIPLSENTLLDICSAENNWVPYMECKQYLSELIDTNLLYRVPKSDCINITQDGVSCLAMFFSRIPSSLRDDINLFVRDNRMRFKKRQSYFCDYSKNADGTYTVIMRINNDISTLIRRRQQATRQIHLQELGGQGGECLLLALRHPDRLTSIKTLFVFRPLSDGFLLSIARFYTLIVFFKNLHFPARRCGAQRRPKRKSAPWGAPCRASGSRQSTVIRILLY